MKGQLLSRRHQGTGSCDCCGGYRLNRKLARFELVVGVTREYFEVCGGCLREAVRIVCKPPKRRKEAAK